MAYKFKMWHLAIVAILVIGAVWYLGIGSDGSPSEGVPESGDTISVICYDQNNSLYHAVHQEHKQFTMEFQEFIS